MTAVYPTHESGNARPLLRIADGPRHMTVIDDTVVESVAARCGAAALGVYTYLERRVGRDGTWTCTLASIAEAFGQTTRHIRDAAKALEDAGFLTRTTLYGPGDIPTGIKWNLPHHSQAQIPRTYYEEPTPEPTPEPSCARQQEEVITSRELTPLPPTAKSTPYTEGFDEFYAAYPRHEDRKKALAAWNRIKPDRSLLDEMLTAIAAQRLAEKERQYIPHPTTWLNGERWKDEPPHPNAPRISLNGHDKSARARAAIDAFLEMGGVKR